MFTPNFDRVGFSKLLQSKLRILRASVGASQGEVAEALGLVRSTYVNYELGVKEIPWEKCLAIIFYFQSMPASRELIETMQLLPEEFGEGSK